MLKRWSILVAGIVFVCLLAGPHSSEAAGGKTGSEAVSIPEGATSDQVRNILAGLTDEQARNLLQGEYHRISGDLVTALFVWRRS